MKFSRPAAHLDRLRVAERCVKSASYRHDKNLALRELCEGVLALLETLIVQEEKAGAKSNEDKSAEPPAA